MYEAAWDKPLSGLLLFGTSLPSISPSTSEDPPTLSSAHKGERELAWVIGIIIISAFSASWVPEKVREQHEDRLISMLVLASIWQQTIGKGSSPGNSSMAQDSSHRQNTTTHWGSPKHRGSQNCHTGWLADWLHSGWLTIKDSVGMRAGKKQRGGGNGQREDTWAMRYKKC